MPSRAIVARWQSTMRSATWAARRAVSLSALLDGVQRLGLEGLARADRPRRSRRPGRRDPSSSSRTCPARAATSAQGLLLDVQEADDDVGHLHAGVVDVVLDADARRRGGAAARTKVSPRQALRRWPMWAALLGLMLVCSTMTRPGTSGAGRLEVRASCSSRAKAARSRKRLTKPAAGHLGPTDARSLESKLGREALGDLPRLAPQGLGEIEGGREGQVPEVDARGILEGDGVGTSVPKAVRAACRTASPRRACSSRITAQ